MWSRLYTTTPVSRRFLSYFSTTRIALITHREYSLILIFSFLIHSDFARNHTTPNIFQTRMWLTSKRFPRIYQMHKYPE